MAISLSSLKRATATLPPRILLYGPPGMGKTTLAAEFPDAVFIQVEDGTPAGLEINTFGHLTTFQAVMEALYALADEDHGLGTLVVDSVDKLEALVWAQTCADNKWSSIEDPGYGKGYIATEAVWREFLSICNDLRTRKAMNIVFIAHSSIDRFDDPTAASYSRYDIRLHKRALALFQDEVDAILFLNQDVSVKEEKQGFGKEVKASGFGQRWIYAEGRPSFVAKNRYGLPDKLLFEAGTGYRQMAAFFPNTPPTTAPVENTAPAEAAE
ncbi:ATP-binding protein [Roseibium sp. RKSG952]|uniref:ATP-binding protein n=1 Tax=Roseibium sp. RKSG952 TaxID=2529384 RepID=UPI0012BC89F7|nr:ATP-binding protein [Roseibium sp. RKSG952]MTH95408.1 ATP-binding protein [Roseibium sp. RKSG952]